jgi:two-component system OmpR family response regulator
MAGRPVILIVDDDPQVLNVLADLLGDDYEVIEALDGESALATLARCPVDLVLLDIVMPGLGGFGVLERLRASGCGVKVVMVTGLDRAAPAAAAVKLGAADYVTKPFEAEALLGLLERVLAEPAA